MRFFKSSVISDNNKNSAVINGLKNLSMQVPTPLVMVTNGASKYVCNPEKNAPNRKKHEPKNLGNISANLQSYHWQSSGVGKASVEDMVLLSKINDSSIADNLKKRFHEDKIYTYIGPVLIAVNPFKQLNYFGDKQVDMYQGAAHYEVPPHVYAVSDLMYRNMLSDGDNQCVIISGESGAGKTVSAKFIMDYLTRISGGGERVQHVKDIILKSNPLLEAFGNAKTIRNNNSSRFGKYIEIMFSRGGEPLGGQIQNFLLEKSRVHSLNKGERNFHIFYQICAGSDDEMKENLGIIGPENYEYLNSSRIYTADDINDGTDFQQTIKAMDVMGIDADRQMEIMSVVAAILHMGNIPFFEENNCGHVSNPEYLEFPAYLLGINAEDLNKKLTSRIFDSKWGASSEQIDVTLNLEQTCFARDAWTKGLYSRLFQYIVDTINKELVTKDYANNLGILDIYGFEIFDKNGFEQFCINYVNEKLQQIFIELTLKSEQEEYKSEGIKWKAINYFNNEIVCELIEGKSPPGLFRILDDTCATMSAVSEGADYDFKKKAESQIMCNQKYTPHYSTYREGFIVKHYAGEVSYSIEGFCEKNRDVLFVDIIELMQSSTNAFMRSLFPEDVSSVRKGRPTTAGAKIRNQANSLVATLKTCVPSYIRCIKPNDAKKANDWNVAIIKHQVEYLGLKENVEVKRAGFAYRRPFRKFLQRYAILTKETWPTWRGDERRGIEHIMRHVNLNESQYQLGITKIFIKDPESLYMLEESRERKFNHYAKIIQRAYRTFHKHRHLTKEVEESSLLLQDKKQRRTNSINRRFYYDYIGMEYRPDLLKLLPKREKIEFGLTVNKYDRRYKKTKRDLIVTKTYLFLIGREKIKKGTDRGKIVEVVKRKIDLAKVSKVCLSRFADNFVLICVENDYESLLEVEFKTELIMVLNRRCLKMIQRPLNINITDRFEYGVKKNGWLNSGNRQVLFMQGGNGLPILTVSGTSLTVRVPEDLPANTRPGTHLRRITGDVRSLKQTFGQSHPMNNNTKLKGPSTPQQMNLIKVLRPVQNRFNQARSNSVYPPPPVQPAPQNQPYVRPQLPKKPVIPPKRFIKQVRVIYDYDARDTDELTIVEGETLELIQEDDSGWWTCMKNGQKGFCPGNYIEKI